MRTEIEAAPLIVFRIGFGLMMLISIIRFWALGWVDKLYIQPEYFFSYRYFEWVQPLGQWTYLLFAFVALAALCVMIGYRYQLAIVCFFCGFTYIELLDKTTYLNHYYFISLLSLLLVFIPIPAGLGGSKVDRGRSEASGQPNHPPFIGSDLYVHALRLFVAIVYFYAGLAKLNSDWLLHAQPLATWLPANYDIPMLGGLLQQRWVHFAFAWGGAAYDLAIPFLLYWKKTRWLAFALVVVFHALTRILFPIGMFPYIMIVAATVFLSPAWNRSVLRLIARLPIPFPKDSDRLTKIPTTNRTMNLSYVRVVAIGLLLLFHHLFPFRYLASKDELFWTEDGYRYSWRVMLMEKAGIATFRVEEPGRGRRTVIDNRDFLTVFQEKQMATQPDFILQYAHFLAEHYAAAGYADPAVYVDSYVALNGRLSQRYVDPSVDLVKISVDDPVQTWLAPFNDTIYGL